MPEPPAEKLAVTVAGDGPTVGLVHGFTLTGRCWGPLVEALVEAGHRIVAVDAPGHGGSADLGEAGLWRAADLVVDATGPGVLLGYSMGARMVLHAALAHPVEVRGLVLISGTGGIEDPIDRMARRAADEERARHLEAVGVDRFVEEWVRLPLFADLGADALDLDERRTNTAAGLAASLRHAGTGNQEPVWDRLREIAVPTLVIAGERDERFVAHAARLAAGVGGPTELVVVPGAHHTPHRSRPDVVVPAVVDWLGRLGEVRRAGSGYR